MNTKYSRIFAVATAFLLAFAMMLSLSACKKRIPDYQHPTDNDESGWFSMEMMIEYNVAGFTQPDGTEVTSKPERNTLYLSGGEDTFKTTALYAFEAISSVNDGVYIPVGEEKEDGSLEIAELEPIASYNATELYPDGDKTTVTFVYTLSRRILECSISLENDNQVCISFADRSEAYGDLI